MLAAPAIGGQPAGAVEPSGHPRRAGLPHDRRGGRGGVHDTPLGPPRAGEVRKITTQGPT
eukprot:8532943-Pyramimonas_sp.AAC.2